MPRALVIGEKTSQIKKFVETLCGTSSTTTKLASMIYSYEGTWTSSTKITYNFLFLPLSGHISTIDTGKGYGWGECAPIAILKNDKALQIVNEAKYVSILLAAIIGIDELWLATDPDAEGDNIAYEAVSILNPIIVEQKITIKRIWNDSLTQKEILRSFESPRPWTDRLAMAVQGRRMADAWLGFAGTREVTNAARQIIKVKVVSVGRVQLPTLNLIVERDLEHESFISQKRWKLVGTFKTASGENFEAEYLKGPFDDKAKAQTLEDKLKTTKDAVITKVDKRVQANKPPSPLNTTAAVSLLCKIMKVTAEQALKFMEDLYQDGFLSYPRTENRCFKSEFPHGTIMSQLTGIPDYLSFINKIQSTVQVRVNGPKKAEEDHDPIHPTGELAGLDKLDKVHYRSWDILARHYMSLFMDDQLLDKVDASILILDEEFWAKGSVLRDPGWKEPHNWDIEKEQLLPKLQIKDKVAIEKLEQREYDTKPRPRWTDAQIIVAMERAKIGTKSTRPSILAKLEERQYVMRDKRQIISTELGRALISTLKPIWPEIVTPEFTAHVEELMDQVARNEVLFEKMIEKLKDEYLTLHLKLQSKIPDYQTILKSVKDKIEPSEDTMKGIKGKKGKTFVKTPKKGTIKKPKGYPCPKCNSGIQIKRQNRTTGEYFLGCSQYPQCKWTKKL